MQPALPLVCFGYTLPIFLAALFRRIRPDLTFVIHRHSLYPALLGFSYFPDILLSSCLQLFLCWSSCRLKKADLAAWTRHAF